MSQRSHITIAVQVCTALAVTFFLAQGATRVAAARFFPLDRTVADVTTAQASPIARANPDRLLRRNIFDSSARLSLQRRERIDPVKPNSGTITSCEGSLRLVGAVTTPRQPARSVATIIGAAGKAMVYRSGQSLDGHEVVEVGTHAVILRPSDGNECRIAMFDAPAQVAQTSTPPREATANHEAGGVTRLSEGEYQVERALIDRIVGNPAEFMAAARIVPHEQGGRVVGLKLYGVRRNSLLGRIGLQNGDMLRAVNGFDISNPESALEVYARLRSAARLTVSIVRRGQELDLRYVIQ